MAKKLPTLEESWQEFFTTVYPDGTPPNQKADIEKAFKVIIAVEGVSSEGCTSKMELLYPRVTDQPVVSMLHFRALYVRLGL